jgi:hypothetical protein
MLDPELKHRLILTGGICCTLRDFPEGAPSGVVYAALMSQGVDYQMYSTLVAGMSKLGLLRQSGNLLFPTDKGNEAAAAFDMLRKEVA